MARLFLGNQTVIPLFPEREPDETYNLLTSEASGKESNSKASSIVATLAGDTMDETVLDLWVKAGSDGTSLGGDPLSQQLFMILLLKGADPKCRFNVRTLNEARPPPEFRSAGLRRAPALQHGEDVAYSHPDEIVEYIDHVFPAPSLNGDDIEAESATADLFRAFCFFIKDVKKDPKALLSELYRLDQYLTASNHRFLIADELRHIDCRVLPKLHSIRIVTKALKNVEVPVDLHALWRYLDAAYNNDVFRKSCPSDQEIILYWAERSDSTTFPPSKRSQLSRQKPIHTLVVPEGALEDSNNTDE
uniref:Chloride intracellular channel protein n=1 Tax=Panagrellus redivivus TaxID=6233 RepID=A0A7E4V0B7_PANRE